GETGGASESGSGEARASSGETGGAGESGSGDARASSGEESTGETGTVDSGSGESSGGTGSFADSDAFETSEETGGISCRSTFDGSGHLGELSDEFDDPNTRACWFVLHEVEGAAPTFDHLDIAETVPGAMTMLPRAGGWFHHFHGPLLYKEVAGDFMLEVEASATSIVNPGGVPTRPFNSTGLLLRDQ